MITKIEKALLERLRRGLGKLVFQVESYSGQLDDKDLDIRRLPAVLTSYGGSRINPVAVGSSVGKRFKNSDTFVVLVMTRSYRSDASGRHGDERVIGANQLIEAVKYLLINQTLGKLVEPLKPLRVRTLLNNVEVKKEKLSAYALEFEVNYFQAAALDDGLFPEGSDDKENVEYLFKHYRGQLSDVPELSGVDGRIYEPDSNAQVGFKVDL